MVQWYGKGFPLPFSDQGPEQLSHEMNSISIHAKLRFIWHLFMHEGVRDYSLDNAKTYMLGLLENSSAFEMKRSFFIRTTQ